MDAPLIEILCLPGCPHVDSARALVRTCLERAGLDVSVEERVGDYPSPTVLVDGVDIMGAPATSGPACRLDLPTEARLMDALRARLR